MPIVNTEKKLVAVAISTGTGAGGIWSYYAIASFLAPNQRTFLVSICSLGASIGGVTGFFLAKSLLLCIDFLCVRRLPSVQRAERAAARASVSFKQKIPAVQADPRGLSPHICRILSTLSEEELGKLPSDLFCPILRSVMVDPVQADDGYSYERAALQRAYDSGDLLCPIGRHKPLRNPRTLPTNLALQRSIFTVLQRKDFTSPACRGLFGVQSSPLTGSGHGSAAPASSAEGPHRLIPR